MPVRRFVEVVVAEGDSVPIVELMLRALNQVAPTAGNGIEGRHGAAVWLSEMTNLVPRLMRKTRRFISVVDLVGDQVRGRG